jgi:hypothetical protein
VERRAGRFRAPPENLDTPPENPKKIWTPRIQQTEKLDTRKSGHPENWTPQFQ